MLLLGVTSKLSNHLLSELVLFTLRNCCVSCPFDIYLESTGRLPIPEFYGSNCKFRPYTSKSGKIMHLVFISLKVPTFVLVIFKEYEILSSE